MPENTPELKFWAVVILAATLKMLTSKYESWRKAMITWASGVFTAFVFTAPIVDVLRLEPDTYFIPIAALAALTGESMMRWIIAMSPEKLLAMYKDLKK